VSEQAALIGGLLFATFPSHGESVAWISGNTDLLAVALGLAALVVAIGGTGRARCLAAAALTALAMLSKEIALLFPFLTALIVWVEPPAMRGNRSGRPRFERWLAPAAMLAAVVLVTIGRTLVIHGLGGYGGAHLTAKRAGGSLISFTLAALSAPQLGLLRHPILLLVPVGLGAALVFGTFCLWRRADRRAKRLALVAWVWFFVSLLPVLNQPLNLNTRNGDRLLLLPSVGLVLLVSVFVDRFRMRWIQVAVALLIALGATSTILDAHDWSTAGHESRRILAQLERLSSPGRQLVALAVPTDYRAAHLFPDALDIALYESGVRDTTVTTCAPVHAIKLDRHQIAFRAQKGASWIGTSTADSPFDIPVFGGAPGAVSAGCAIAKAQGSSSFYLGTTRAMTVLPAVPMSTSATYVFFDGRDMEQVVP
jgi:hypothetical protein